MRLRRVLIVEDDPSYRRLLCRRFQRANDLAVHAERRYQIFEAENGEKGLDKIRFLHPDAAIVDLHMPRLDGFALAHIIRADSTLRDIRLLLISGQLIPDSMLELASRELRIGPILRKGGSDDPVDCIDRLINGEAAGILRRGPLTIDLDAHEIFINGRNVHIGDRRFDLLCVFLRNRKPLTKKELLEAVWPGSENPNLLDVTLLRLRHDLQPYPHLSIDSTPAGFVLNTTHHLQL